jgi:peptidoglycan endopeptidase LytE
MIIRQVLVACALGATLLATPMVADAAGTEVGTVYEVRPGDSLSGIAARYDVSIASLLRVNDLQLTSLILPGQHLQLPAGATAPTPAAAPSTTSTTGGTHTVEWGDSLSGIAARYDVSIASLLRVNDLQLTSLILPGRHLQLPAGATAPAPAAAKTENREIQTVLTYARAQIGKPYRFFTRGPDAFDCSGLTAAAYARAGITLIHYSAAQSLQGTAVDFEHETIKPGDLVFLKRHGSTIINHVGIAVTSSIWIQATGPGDTVRIGPMPAKSTISAVRRYIDN